MVQFEFYEGQSETAAARLDELTARAAGVAAPRGVPKPKLSAMGALKALLTSTEPRVLEQLFDRIDRNHDGLITADELSFFVAQSGKALSKGAVEGIIRLGDLNGDGRIDATEWKNLATVWADIASLREELATEGGGANVDGDPSLIPPAADDDDVDTESSPQAADALSDRWSTFGGALDAQADAMLIPASASVPQAWAAVNDTSPSPSPRAVTTKAPHTDQLHGSSEKLAQAGTPRRRGGGAGGGGGAAPAVIKDGFVQVEGHGSHSVWLTLSSAQLSYHATRHDLSAPIRTFPLGAPLCVCCVATISDMRRSATCALPRGTRQGYVSDFKSPRRWCWCWLLVLAGAGAGAGAAGAGAGAAAAAAAAAAAGCRGDSSRAQRPRAAHARRLQVRKIGPLPPAEPAADARLGG
jgi:hypothetical protein